MTVTVEIFKTDVQAKAQAVTLLSLLSQGFPLFKMNFDLDDCDKILRVEGAGIAPEKITEVLTANGFLCQVLD